MAGIERKSRVELCAEAESSASAKHEVVTLLVITENDG